MFGLFSPLPPIVAPPFPRLEGQVRFLKTYLDISIGLKGKTVGQPGDYE